MPKNVLTDFPMSAGYYLKRPWKFFKELHYNLKYAYQRATRGYCDADWYDMDRWMAYVLPSMFRDLANKGQAYPANERFQTREDWEAWLNAIADMIEQSAEEKLDHKNIYYEEWVKQIDIENFQRPNIELEKKYMDRYNELYQESQVKLIKAFTEIGENFYSLWD